MSNLSHALPNPIHVLGLVLVASLVSCETTKSRTEPVDSPAVAEPGPSSSAAVDPVAEQSLGDVRLVLHQANGAQTMILVNRGNPRRTSLAGQRQLAMGIPDHGYKVLSEEAMTALLTSLDQYNFERLASDFERGDETWFNPRADDRRYRGILYIERNGTRRKILGFRPAGRDDGVGHQRYQAFVNLKLVFMRWFVSTTATEVPGGVQLGGR